MILRLPYGVVSVIKKMAFFVKKKINFAKPGPLQKFKMELFVIIVNYLLTLVASSLDPPWLNYDFQRTEEGCSNVNYLVVYVDGGRTLLVLIPNTKRNHDFNETILETLSIPEEQRCLNTSKY